MAWELNKDRFSYILRYFLQEKPRYDRATTERRIDELIDYCKENSIEAVMLYVDANPYWYYMPDSIEHTLEIKDIIAYAGAKLRNAGISYQLNYQNLPGAVDGNCDHTSYLDWECYTDEFGNVSKGSACLIGEKFRRIAGEKLRIWAETNPDVIWIDDDLRFHNHTCNPYNGINSSVTDFGCFCDKHIAEFNKKYNSNYDRDSLHKAILERGGASDAGKNWRQFCAQCYEETALWIEKTIHSVSPDTRIGIMTSLPDIHAQEGREWGSFLKALCGEHKPIVRSHYGPYGDAALSPRAYVFTHIFSEQLETNINGQYNGEVDYAPEIENGFFTQYSKSVAATSFQLMLSAFQGYKGITLSITDLEGYSLIDEKLFGKLLKERKNYCDIMAKMISSTLKTTGVGFITSPTRYPDAEKETTDAIGKYIPKRHLDSFFEKLGFPCRYVLPENVGECELIVLDSDSVIQLTDDELINCLSRGVFADAGAAKKICERGFGRYIGVISGETGSVTIGSELMITKKNQDGSERYLPARIPVGDWRILTLDGAKCLTEVSTPDGKRYPGFTMFENSLGGKVCVYTAEGQGFSDRLCSTYRIDLLRDVVQELSPGVVMADFPSYAMMTVREDDYTTAVFISNFAADKIKDITVKFAKKPKSVNMITADSKVSELSICGKNVVAPCELNMFESVVLTAQY